MKKETTKKCFKHLISTDKFENRAGNREFEIYHRVNCKSKSVIYLGKCIRCNHKPYVGKCEGQAMNRRANKHRGVANKANSIPIDKHF